MHMKTIKNVLVAGMLAVFGCSLAKAQNTYSNYLIGATLIYSNGFDGAMVNISNTPPDYAVTLFGGTNEALWIDAAGSGDTNAFYANGDIGTAQGDSILLPFYPQTNQVYILSASVTFSGNPGNWVGLGFAQNYAIPGLGNARFADSGVNGYDFSILTESSGNIQFFGGPHATLPIFNQNSFFTPGTGTHILTQILDTTGRWIITSYLDGIQAGTNAVPFASNPALAALGITQNNFTAGAQSDVHWNWLTLSANQLVFMQQPASASTSQGAAFTNTVVVGGAQPFSYQWYTNGVPLVNGGGISGATNAALIINPVSTNNMNTNYYVVVTNIYGAITSSPASLTVYTAPVFSSLLPVAYTNLITLYGGTNVDGTNYPGSSPTFSVIAAGANPIYYQWLTNGVAVGGVTNSSFSLKDCQLNSPTNFTCIVSNSFGEATNAWSVEYLPTPIAPFPDGVLALNPIGYWRLNEPDCCGGETGPDNGLLCHDYASGHDGIYTNLSLGWPGYNPTSDPLETSAQFGEVDENGDSGDSDANSIAGINFATNTSTAFTIEAWVAGYAQSEDAGIVTLGWGGGGEQFDLDTGANDPNHDFRFLVRDAGGTLHTVSSSISTLSSIGSTSITPWYEVVGVVDEISNQTVSLYVNGVPAGTASITSGSGIWTATNVALGQPMLMSIGSRMGSETGNYSYQFYGNVNDVAVFNYALNLPQVAQLYEDGGGAIPSTLVTPLPPTNSAYLQSSGTLTVPATAFGTPPIGYYWTNLNNGTVLASGATNVLEVLNATLAISNVPPGLSGDVLELVVTNAYGSTNWFTTLSSLPPPVALSYTNPILYSNDFNGAAYSIAGTPLTEANTLVGGANAANWTDALGTNDTGAVLANGVVASLEPDSWVLPFTPEAGYIYTLTASLTFDGNPGNWVGLGFAQRVPTNAVVGYGRFSDGGSTPPEEGPNGYDWIILTESSGNVQYFAGAGGSAAITNGNGFFTIGAGTHTVQVLLNTTTNHWIISSYVDGVQAGTNYPYPSNPPIGAAGFTQNTPTAIDEVQWNYLTLSQVAPGGVPPYLLAPLPPTNSILLTNQTVTVSATAYGSGPLGYYWSDNSTVVGSGTTNNTAPINATLSVPASSLSGGQLSLTVTNAYGTNVTLITLVSSINTNPTNIVWSVTNGNLYLSWPTDHTGWTLQAQTNSLSVGLSTNWVNVAASTSTNQVEVPMNLTNGSVFYRLLYTP